MKTVFAVTAVISLLCLCVAAEAVTMETVAVDDKGNAGELTGSSSVSRICGAVGYDYNIGKYEVTAAQYTDFLNHKASVSDPYGLYNTNMTSTYGCKIQRNGNSGNYTYSVSSDWANRPVNYVSFWDALRFTNWLNNGQGGGDTETGAYTLTTSGIANNTITRNGGVKWFVPSEDEWYKAAYYKGGGTDAGYWDYATQSNSTPNRDYAGTNAANYYATGYLDPTHYVTEVGAFRNSTSTYGTLDQNGNVWEWTESIKSWNYAYRHLRGGSFDVPAVTLEAMHLYDYIPDSYYLPSNEDSTIGFRVAAVPEPSSLLGLLSCVGGLGGLMWRRRN